MQFSAIGTVNFDDIFQFIHYHFVVVNIYKIKNNSGDRYSLFTEYINICSISIGARKKFNNLKVTHVHIGWFLYLAPQEAFAKSSLFYY